LTASLDLEATPPAATDPRSGVVAPLIDDVDVLLVTPEVPHVQLCRRTASKGLPEYGWMTQSLAPAPVFFSVLTMGYEPAFRRALRARLRALAKQKQPATFTLQTPLPDMPEEVAEASFVHSGRGELWVRRFNATLPWSSVMLHAPRGFNTVYWLAKTPDQERKLFSLFRHGYATAFHLALSAAGESTQCEPPPAPPELDVREDGAALLRQYNRRLTPFALSIRRVNQHHWWVDRKTDKPLCHVGRHYQDSFIRALRARTSSTPNTAEAPPLPLKLEANLASESAPPPPRQTTRPAPWHVALNRQLPRGVIRLDRHANGHFYWQVTVTRGPKLGKRSVCLRLHGYEQGFYQALNLWARSRNTERPSHEPPECPEALTRILQRSPLADAERIRAHVRFFNGMLPDAGCVRLVVNSINAAGVPLLYWTADGQTTRRFSVNKLGYLPALRQALASRGVRESELDAESAAYPALPEEVARRLV
jgi:hypothetical protein